MKPEANKLKGKKNVPERQLQKLAFERHRRVQSLRLPLRPLDLNPKGTVMRCDR